MAEYKPPFTVTDRIIVLIADISEQMENVGCSTDQVSDQDTDQDNIKTLRKIPERLHYNLIFVKSEICSLFQKLFSQ